MSAIGATATLPWMWLVSRGSGLVLLVLFTAVFVMGISTRLGSGSRSMHRFAIAELHRALALFAVVLLLLHVVSAILDPYVAIGWWATVLPFAAHYRPLALGLGALAVDLGAAVLLTSLARRRVGHRLWRAVHWLAYLSWPLAFVHSLSAGGDMKTWWVAALVWGSAIAVIVAIATRVFAATRGKRTPRVDACLRPTVTYRATAQIGGR
jgi:methionine sulfoxide reductase heme-binding subunit